MRALALLLLLCSCHVHFTRAGATLDEATWLRTTCMNDPDLVERENCEARVDRLCQKYGLPKDCGRP
jgi:hypothetical protein